MQLQVSVRAISFMLKMIQEPRGFSTVLKVFLLVAITNNNIINMDGDVVGARRAIAVTKPWLAQTVIAIPTLLVHLTQLPGCGA